MSREALRAAALALLVFGATAPPADAGVTVHWMAGYRVPGTPAKYDRVGVVEVGPAHARNVLVLEPGTSAGGAYFVPLAKWIVATVPGWQVWSIERRENLLEDQSELNLAKRGNVNGPQLFDYYLGWLTNPQIKRHFQFLTMPVGFAKRWGMKVAVEDLHGVIAAANRLGGKVVLGGHSLGGSVVTAYATWNFNGHTGASQLAGLVYIDGYSRPAESAAAARSSLSSLDAASASPWLTFGNFTAPYSGLFSSTGALGALIDPNAPSIGQQFSLLPANLKPSVPVTNIAQYGYALNVGTSPISLIAAQAHLGAGIAAGGNPHGWNSAGALTPIRRYAQMFGGAGLPGIDGTEWYFPQRLADDTKAVGNGLANAAQKVLGVDATMGRRLPHSLLIYAFGARIGGARVLAATRALAQQSGIPSKNLTLINRQRTYAHNDPAGAYPRNVFFATLVPFLKDVAAH